MKENLKLELADGLIEYYTFDDTTSSYQYSSAPAANFEGSQYFYSESVGVLVEADTGLFGGGWTGHTSNTDYGAQYPRNDTTPWNMNTSATGWSTSFWVMIPASGAVGGDGQAVGRDLLGQSPNRGYRARARPGQAKVGRYNAEIGHEVQ